MANKNENFSQNSAEKKPMADATAPNFLTQLTPDQAQQYAKMAPEQQAAVREKLAQKMKQTAQMTPAQQKMLQQLAKMTPEQRAAVQQKMAQNANQQQGQSTAPQPLQKTVQMTAAQQRALQQMAKMTPEQRAELLQKIEQQTAVQQAQLEEKLTATQRAALQKIEQMTDAQRSELQQRLETTPAEQKELVWQALQVYATKQTQRQRHHFATQQLERAVLEHVAAQQAAQKIAAEAAQKAAADTAEKASAKATSKPQKRKAKPKENKGKEKAKRQLMQLAEGMQRAANDGALAEAREADFLPPRLVYNALGQLLYRIGLQTEYALLRFWRTSCSTLRLGLLGVRLLMRTVLRPIGTLLRGIGHDLAEPVVRVITGLRNMSVAMKEAGQKGENKWQTGLAHLQHGVQTYRHVGYAALTYLLPVAAAAVFGVTAWTVLGAEYSLAVEYNGQMIGFVENETVWEDAQSLVKSRIRAGGEGEFSAHPDFSVQVINPAGRTSAQDLADTIIETSSDQITLGTGVYVGEMLVGVTDDTKGVQRLKENALAVGLEEGNDAVRTEFVQDIRMVNGVYLTSSVVGLAQLESTMEANNYAQVKIIRTQTYEEELAFEVVEEESDKYYKGTKRVLQKGKNGTQQVTADIAYIDGVEVERVPLSAMVLEEPVPQRVQVGTKEVSGSISIGTGIMTWPVPNFSGITTQFGQGGHRGLDICAPYGTPVYAIDGGTVVEAVWHYSWGNYIKIDHGNGISSLYAHNSQLMVSAGMTVARGQNIALMGSTGNSSGNHLHIELYINGGLTNPMNYISG